MGMPSVIYRGREETFNNGICMINDEKLTQLMNKFALTFCQLPLEIEGVLRGDFVGSIRFLVPCAWESTESGNIYS